ncbi:MAG: SMC family ATPase [Phascolarctobacterium sp.]|uniref:AAA family ATPase n=1 Tax=Phascolarctobacterium sp. TaxID=2049039 RepID=UPI0025ECFCBB|nr:SMC family ATPase [Phascolarctobacterium sp.]MCC8158637.1 SMC family ATPase [Phascolarctobacterium sp.]
MKPLQLTMRAFGAYADEQTIDFTLLGDKNFFLIHGPTGSGKTTILDAISFALYGSASGDLRESKSLRSDYAPAEQKTEVEFTFKSGEHIYQVLRAPEQELKKQRGEGTRKVPAAAALFKLLSDGSKDPLAAKSDEVTKKVTEIIGFKAEQFRQIVLLPQGEFRRFLIAESKDRKAILETIFKTELYRRIETLLAERSSTIDNNYQTLKQQRQFILDSTECADSEQLDASIQLLLQRQKEETAALQTAAARLTAAKLQLQQAQQLHNAFTEAAAAQAALLTLTEQRSAVAAIKTEASQAEKAALLEEIYNSTLRAHKHNQECQTAAQNALQATLNKKNDLQELHRQLSEQLQQLDGQAVTTAADLNKALELLNQRILQLHSEAAKLSGVTAELERLAAALADNEPCPVCGSLQHPHPATVSAAQRADLQRQTQIISNQTRALQQLQQQYQQTQLQLAGCEATQKSTQTAAEAAMQEFSALRQHFKERLEASDFDSQAAFLAAMRTEARRQQLQQTIAAYEQNLAAATDRLQRAQNAIDGKTAPDLTACQDTEQQADALYRQLTAQTAVTAKELTDLQTAQLRLQELEKQMGALQEAYQTAASLAETARGNNPSRLTFSAFVLQAILDDVLQAANLRLTSMSRGRYSLSRTGDVLDARRENGLNIEVTDSFTGVARPVKTLSGGELFLASLSLALGLSDIVQAYAGGIRLDTILVDEGFGTLDSEALDMAIRTLTDLQKGGRLVGIISHVSELRERITARLEVIPGQRGSKAVFHV